MAVRLPSPPTLTVPLPGGQARIKEAILYVAVCCASARFFGSTKLNKIIWKADFRSFAARGVPVTGRPYRKRPFGPALHEMLPVHRGMQREGLIRVDSRDFGDGFIEDRTIPLIEPKFVYLLPEDFAFIDEAVKYYWELTGGETSDESHGPAWRTRKLNDPIPYELAYLNEKPLSLAQTIHIEQLIYEKGWISE
jgi:hypothetical protein